MVEKLPYFSEKELRTIKLFAEIPAIAIDNYNLYQQQQDFNQALETEVAFRTEGLKPTFRTSKCSIKRLRIFLDLALLRTRAARPPSS